MAAKANMKKALIAIDDARLNLENAKRHSGEHIHDIRKAIKELDEAAADLRRAISELREENESERG
ncbi:MAG: hypothetical protein ACKVQK_00420 [Burkholderiales bacterium]